VQAVVGRHEPDAPAARLAGALAPCFVLAEDADLNAYGFGNRDWLPMVHAFANHAEMEMVAGAVYMPTMVSGVVSVDAGRVFMRWPRWAQLALLLFVGIGVYLWQRDGRARRHVDKAKEKPELPMEELTEWLRRAHAKTLRGKENARDGSGIQPRGGAPKL
jgi:hypothetical protein